MALSKREFEMRKDLMNISQPNQNLEGLKKRKREGWVRRGIQNPESMADHSYRVAIMALILSPEAKLDPEKTIHFPVVELLYKFPLFSLLEDKELSVNRVNIL